MGFIAFYFDKKSVLGIEVGVIALKPPSTSLKFQNHALAR
jgi:hypothetical protein